MLISSSVGSLSILKRREANAVEVEMKGRFASLVVRAIELTRDTLQSDSSREYQ